MTRRRRARPCIAPALALVPLAAACSPIGIAVDEEVAIRAEEELPISFAGEMPVAMRSQVPVRFDGQMPVVMESKVNITTDHAMPVSFGEAVPIRTDGEMPVRMSGTVPVAFEGPININLTFPSARYEGVYISEALFELVEPGTTTDDWVLAVYGEPTRRSALRDNSEIWVWEYIPLTSQGAFVSLIGGGDDEEPTPMPTIVYLRFVDRVVTEKWRG